MPADDAAQGGPNTEPWGTPQVTLLVCDFALPWATFSVLSVRYEVNQFLHFLIVQWCIAGGEGEYCGQPYQKQLLSLLIQEDEERWGAGVCCHQEVICDPDQGCFCTVAIAETRLEFFKQVMLYEVILELCCNCFFQNF